MPKQNKNETKNLWSKEHKISNDLYSEIAEKTNSLNRLFELLILDPSENNINHALMCIPNIILNSRSLLAALEAVAEMHGYVTTDDVRLIEYPSFPIFRKV